MNIEIFPVLGLPEIRKGDDISLLLHNNFEQNKFELMDEDIIVIAQKIISKAEGRIVKYEDVVPSEKAIEISRAIDKDPIKVEVILSESEKIIRAEKRNGKEGIIIAKHRLGFISANAGVDESNTGGKNMFILLPLAPDQSARMIRDNFFERSGKKIGVIITDTFGRPWRLGLTNVAIGSAGIELMSDYRGKKDSDDKKLSATVIAFADEIAAASGLVMGKLNRIPAVVIRGLKITGEDKNISDMIRPEAEDLFI